jgi:hypothetical protein
VADLLFRPGAARELYKRPRNTYDFKNKVLSAIKAIRNDRVNGPGTHSSSNNPNDNENLLEVDKLSMRLYVEYQEVVDIQEALRCDNLLEKENIQNASNFLAPYPQPLPCSSDVIWNPLSAIFNKAPALVNNDVSPKPTIGTKKQ